MARRVPAVERDKVADEHKAAYDEVAGVRGRAPTVGPSSVLIYSPEMAVLATRLSSFLAEKGELPQKFVRLAAMIGARSMDCPYIWNAQAPQGRKAGLSDALCDALRDKKPIPDTPLDEVAMVSYGLELAGTCQVKQATFDAALGQLGARGLTEFTTALGHFRMLALNANAFNIDPPEQLNEPLLPI